MKTYGKTFIFLKIVINYSFMRSRFVSSTNAVAYTSEQPPSQIHIYDTLLRVWLLPWDIVPYTRPGSPTSVIIMFKPKN